MLVAFVAALLAVLHAAPDVDEPVTSTYECPTVAGRQWCPAGDPGTVDGSGDATPPGPDFVP